MKPKGGGQDTQDEGNQRENDDADLGMFSRLWFLRATTSICRCQSHGYVLLLVYLSGCFNLLKFNLGGEENLVLPQADYCFLSDLEQSMANKRQYRNSSKFISMQGCQRANECPI